MFNQYEIGKLPHPPLLGKKKTGQEEARDTIKERVSATFW